MPEVDVINIEKEKIRRLELDQEIFGAPVKSHLLHEFVVSHLSNRRQGSVSTKTKGLVRGGGRKPWRQKGTGRARAGSIRSPLWRGGGTVFGPQVRDYSYKVTKKVKWAAMNSALSAKVASGDIIVVDRFEIPEPKTKILISILKRLGLDSSLLIIAKNEPNLELAARNIPHVKVQKVECMNPYDILTYKKLLLTPEVVTAIQEVFI